jgi:hypothetical protein
MPARGGPDAPARPHAPGQPRRHPRGVSEAARGRAAARKAIGYYEQNLAIAREIGDQLGENTALWNMAIALDGLGDRERAVACAKESLAIQRAIEDPFTPTAEAWLHERGVDV